MKTFLLLLATATALTVVGESVRLAWDANSEPDVGSYILYAGTNSRGYTMATNVGRVTEATMSGLEPGRTWYFALVAMSTAGLTSDFSNEVTNAIPPVAPRPPQRVLLCSGVESAPTPDGPWSEVLTTYLPITIESNKFYRPKLSIEPPPLPEPDAGPARGARDPGR